MRLNQLAHHCRRDFARSAILRTNRVNSAPPTTPAATVAAMQRGQSTPRPSEHSEALANPATASAWLPGNRAAGEIVGSRIR